MLAEVLEHYKRKRRADAADMDKEASTEDEEQPTSPPAEDEDQEENPVAIQIWDEFMGEQISELPDTDYIKKDSSLIFDRAAKQMAVKAGFQLLADHENFIRDP